LEQSKALAVQGQTLITTVLEMKDVAGIFAASGYFPDAKAMAQAFVKIATGRELGFHPMASMTGIAIIQGKPAIGANLMASKIRMSGYDYRVKELDNEKCSIEFFSPAKESLGTTAFTMADAATAGLTGKDNWKNYKRNMLFARTISNGIRFFCPEIMQGTTVYTPDELGATVDEDGNAKMEIRADYKVGNGTSAPAQQEPPQDDKPQDPYSDPEQQKRSEIVQFCLALTAGDMEQAKALLEQTTRFKGKDREEVSGVNNTSKLSGKRLDIAHAKLHKMADEAAAKVAPAPVETTTPEQVTPEDDELQKTLGF
jgi:hypothetical protein